MIVIDRITTLYEAECFGMDGWRLIEMYNPFRADPLGVYNTKTKQVGLYKFNEKRTGPVLLDVKLDTIEEAMLYLYHRWVLTQ